MDTDTKEFKYAKKFWTERIASQGMNLSKALTDTKNDISVVRREMMRWRNEPPEGFHGDITKLKDDVEYIYNNWQKVMLGDQEEDNEPNTAKEVPTVSSAKFQKCGDKLYDVSKHDDESDFKNCQEAVKNKENCEKLTKLENEKKRISDLISDGTTGREAINKINKEYSTAITALQTFQDQYPNLSCTKTGGRKRKSRKRRKRKTKRRRRRGGVKTPTKKGLSPKKPSQKKPSQKKPSPKKPSLKKKSHKKKYKSTVEEGNSEELMKIIVRRKSLPPHYWTRDGHNNPIKYLNTRKGGRKRRRRRTKKRRRRRRR